MVDVSLLYSGDCLLMHKTDYVSLGRLNKTIALTCEPEDVDICQRIVALEVSGQRPIQMESSALLRICSRLSLESQFMKESVLYSIWIDIEAAFPELDYLKTKNTG